MSALLSHLQRLDGQNRVIMQHVNPAGGNVERQMIVRGKIHTKGLVTISRLDLRQTGEIFILA